MDKRVVLVGAGRGVGLRAALLSSSLSQNAMLSSFSQSEMLESSILHGSVADSMVRMASVRGGFSADLIYKLERTIADQAGLTVNQARSAIRGFERSVLDVAKYTHEIQSFENEYDEPVWVSRKKGEGMQKAFGQSKHNNR